MLAIALFVFGCTYILCDSHIMDSPRMRLCELHGDPVKDALGSFFRALISCYFCVGFWVALLTSCIFIPFGYGCIVHAVTYAASTYILNATVSALWKLSA